MPDITITYTSYPSVTIPGTSVAIVAVPGDEYLHDNKAVDNVSFRLGSATTATVTVTPSGSTMPDQSCFAGAATSLGLPLIADWTMSIASAGVLTLTIPSIGSATYASRLQIIGGANVDILVKH